MLQAIKKTRIYEAVVAQLGQLIHEGKLKPGDRLPTERQLASQLQVSRASLREALRGLELQGLVVSRQGSGTFIAGLGPEELLRAFNGLTEQEQSLREIFEVRLLLEPPIAALASQRATPNDLERLEAALREQEERSQRDESVAEQDVAFHSALAESTHNQALLRLGATLVEVLAPSRDPRLQTRRRSQLSLRSHREVLEAVRAGDPEAARRAMEAHVGQVDRVSFGLREGALNLPAIA